MCQKYRLECKKPTIFFALFDNLTELQKNNNTLQKKHSSGMSMSFSNNWLMTRFGNHNFDYKRITMNNNYFISAVLFTKCNLAITFDSRHLFIKYDKLL